MLTLVSASDTDLESGSLEKGVTFQDEVNNVLITLVALVKRAKELTALRLKKDKLLSKESAEALSTLADEIQEIYQDIDTMLSQASPEEVEEVNVEANETIKRTIEILTETVGI
jgi:hypothetical protein